MDWSHDLVSCSQVQLHVNNPRVLPPSRFILTRNRAHAKRKEGRETALLGINNQSSQFSRDTRVVCQK